MGKTHYCLVFGEIDNEMSRRVCQRLTEIALEAEDSDQVAMIIKSTGGIAGQAYEIIDALSSLKLPIITVGHKIVGSAATIILASGQIRLVTTKTNIVHHQIRLICSAKEGLYSPASLIDMATNILVDVEQMSIEQEKIWSLTTRNSLLTPKKIKKMLKQANGQNLYFNARQAKKFRLVHYIVPNIRALPSYIKKHFSS